MLIHVSFSPILYISVCALCSALYVTYSKTGFIRNHYIDSKKIQYLTIHNYFMDFWFLSPSKHKTSCVDETIKIIRNQLKVAENHMYCTQKWVHGTTLT